MAGRIQYDERGDVARESHFGVDGTELMPLEIVISELTSGAQAERLGLQVGDAVVSFAGIKITTKAQFNELIKANRAPEAELEITRAETPVIFKLKPGALGAQLEEKFSRTP